MRSLLLILLCCWQWTALAQPLPVVIKGDFAAEPRTAGHVDVVRLVEQLKAIHANTYFWLVWHSEHDWSDLRYFLPLARQAGIQVWVYLVPQSETPAGGGTFKRYSEPFRLDYVRWAEEIAHLSLAHDNLVGYVIDDFWENAIPGRFSPDYAAQMVAAGQAINPHLLFFPLIYFHELDDPRLSQLQAYAQGMVVAYPPSKQALSDVQRQWQGRENKQRGWRIRLGYKPVPAGELVGVERPWQMEHSGPIGMRLSWKDNYNYFRSGQRAIVVTVNDQIVYQEDLATYQNQQIQLPLDTFKKLGDLLHIRVGLKSLNGEARLPLMLEISDLEMTDLVPATPEWRVFGASPLAAVEPLDHKPLFQRAMPVIVMPAAEHAEYLRRYGTNASSEGIADRVSEAMQMRNSGIAGVVTYCLDKAIGGEDARAVAEVFQQY